MIKMNFTNDQTAFDYALYMIAASYFDRTSCRSEMTERNMLLQYKEQRLDKQYEMEDICIRFMDELTGELPKKLFQQQMEVYFRKNAARNMTEVLFANKHLVIGFYGRYAGKKTHITYQVWVKKEAKQTMDIQKK